MRMGEGNNNGKFVISLDFELMWGVRDLVTLNSYGKNLTGVHTALPKLLSVFSEYGINSTFASVGFLFFENKADLLNNLPDKTPSYKKMDLSPYGDYLKYNLGEGFPSDPYHYGLHLIKDIKNTPGQEISTHTFCHYYCLEKDQTLQEFESDLKAAVNAAKRQDIQITSIVFPRNQFNENYLKVCEAAGIIAYRNNEESWLYNARSGDTENIFRRAFRLIDAYINISGHHCYTAEYMNKNTLKNIPSSRFLRPYSKALNLLEGLRLNRIKKSMTYAAKHGLMFHLWWHPHNFGVNQDENFAFLKKILEHYRYLNKQYSFKSYTMTALANELLGNSQTL